jgi:hypothetical protein
MPKVNCSPAPSSSEGSLINQRRNTSLRLPESLSDAVIRFCRLSKILPARLVFERLPVI